jgi:integrase
MQVVPSHFEGLTETSDAVRLTVPDGKTGKRELPVSGDLRQRVTMLKQAARQGVNDPVIDVSKRQVRNWLSDAREQLATDDERRWNHVGMHDLRRTWATDTFYSLAFSGVSIAETLVMSWGGWEQTSTGRETFRQNYLGPVPDHITAEAVEKAGL